MFQFVRVTPVVPLLRMWCTVNKLCLLSFLLVLHYWDTSVNIFENGKIHLKKLTGSMFNFIICPAQCGMKICVSYSPYSARLGCGSVYFLTYLFTLADTYTSTRLSSCNDIPR